MPGVPADALDRLPGQPGHPRPRGPAGERRCRSGPVIGPHTRERRDVRRQRRPLRLGAAGRQRDAVGDGLAVRGATPGGVGLLDPDGSDEELWNRGASYLRFTFDGAPARSRSSAPQTRHRAGQRRSVRPPGPTPDLHADLGRQARSAVPHPDARSSSGAASDSASTRVGATS